MLLLLLLLLLLYSVRTRRKRRRGARTREKNGGLGARDEGTPSSQPPIFLPRSYACYAGYGLEEVSQWYVYPRDMCIPVHISLVICVSPPISLPVICVSPTPLPSKQVPVLFLSFSFYRIFVSFPFDWNKQRARDFWTHGSSCLQCIYFTVYMLYRCIKAQAFDALFIEPRE